jgi:hypothetical protein
MSRGTIDMKLKTALLRGVALGASASLSLGVAAHAETEKTTVKHKHHKVVAAKTESGAALAQAQTAEEIRALKSEIEALKARLDAQGQAQQAVAAQVAQTQSQVTEVAANAQSAQDKVQTIPEQVNVAVAELPKPKTDALYVKGVKVTLGGFIEAAGIYRSKAEGADIASSFSAIPYSGQGSTSTPGSAAAIGHTQELRFSARQSRISGLVEGDFNPDTKLSAYGEFDFISAAQTANSNESNSYNLRIRNVYATIDKTDLGIHLLAGQNWSLVTLNSKGISPRNEVTPPQIDAQYIPGFAWARQPQFRIADQLAPAWWVALSAENPQTTFASGATAPASALRVVYSESAGSGFNSANTLSINHIPDVVAKLAYEPMFMDRQLHLEVFGLFRAYYERTAAGITVVPPTAPATAYTITESATGNTNNNIYGGGVGFGVMVPAIPKVLDLQLTGLFGDGIGRYGSSQLPDVTVRYDGTIEPIRETMALFGATYHANPALDIYAFAGQEQEQRETYTFNGAGYGLGSALYNNTGCFGEITTVTTCTGQTRTVEQATFGLWDKVYQGKIGQFRVGLQYSYTERKAFLGVGGAPSTTDNMIFWSVRYYPFQ